jgi:hypothetical protein
MGIMTTDDDGHVESIVYFLTEALRAAVESGDSVQQSLCEAPQLSPNMSCNEIADKLALYRKHLRAVWSYEVLLVAKIMRARELSKELRALEAELRPELDTFRLATVSCADLKEMLMPSAQNAFNGVDQPRFAYSEHGAAGGATADPLAGYRIAGHTDMRLLLRACEALHYGLAAHYGFEPLPSRSRSHEPRVEEPLVLDEPADGEEAYLLTDFCEILPEPGKPAPTADWHAPFSGNPALPH